MNKCVLIRNKNKSNFIQENGIQPVREFPDGDLYKRTPKLLSLLDAYEIKITIGRKPW